MTSTNCATVVVPGPQGPRHADTRLAAGQVLRVEVARINAYERNPRHSPNREYDRIKASILVHGMDQLLQITRRPAQQDFIVRAGGNTRLQIVKELFAATGEERFGVVECQYLEWQGETDVLLAHLRENDLRGNLTFIDKARAVIDAKGLLAEEHGVDDIAYRELEGILRERGYSVTHAYLSLMSYAASTLLPAMPRALEAGLGKRQVQRIRKLERASRDIWRDHGVGNDAEFDDTFGALCRRYDGDDWVFEPLRQAIEVEIAEAAEADIQSVRMLIDWRLSGQTAEFPDIPEFEPFDEPAPPKTRPEAREKDNDAAASGTGDAASTASQSLDISIELPSADEPEALLRHLINVAAPSQSIEQRRALAHALARRLAERYGLGALIVSSGDDGLGYRVCDWPPASMLASLDAGMRTLVTAIWWQLMSFTDVASAPAEHVSNATDINARLSATLKAGASTSEECPPSIHPAELGYCLWRQLSNEDWRDWLCLAHNYRELHRAAAARNASLWAVGQ